MANKRSIISERIGKCYPRINCPNGGYGDSMDPTSSGKGKERVEIRRFIVHVSLEQSHFSCASTDFGRKQLTELVAYCSRFDLSGGKFILPIWILKCKEKTFKITKGLYPSTMTDNLQDHHSHFCPEMILLSHFSLG